METYPSEGSESLLLAGGTMSGDIDMDSNDIYNLPGTPPTDSSATSKSYVDAQTAGARDVKDSCRAATTANITLSGAQTIDGVSVIAGDRVLVKDQTTASQNGIYVCVDPGAWTRSVDADSDEEVTSGLYTWVNEGTVNSDTGWLLTTNDPIVLGTTSLVFTQISALGQVVAGAGLTKTGPQLDVGSGTGISVLSDSVNLADTAVTPGSYTNSNITVDQQGRLTSASSGSGAPTVVINPSLPYSAAINTFIESNSTGNITLPTPTGNSGQTVTVKLTASGQSLSIVKNAAESINGSTSNYVISELNRSVTLMSDGSNWHVIASDLGGNSNTANSTAFANLAGFNSGATGGGAIPISLSSTTSGTVTQVINGDIGMVLSIISSSPFAKWSQGALIGQTLVTANFTTNGSTSGLTPVDTSGGNKIITLGSAAGTGTPGKLIMIMKATSDANTVTINTTSSQLISGLSSGSIVLANQWDFVLVQADTTNAVDKWNLIASRPLRSIVGTDGGNISGNTTLTATSANRYTVSATATITVPAASAAINGLLFRFVKTTSDTTTFDVTGGGNINGSATYVNSTQYDVIDLQIINGGWYLV